MHFKEGVDAKYEFIVYRYEEFWSGEPHVGNHEMNFKFMKVSLLAECVA
jgi:hypothetical protein